MMVVPALVSAALAGCAVSDAELTEPELTVAPRISTRPLATCAELVDAASGQLNDGEYQLFLDGDEAKPWVAYCADLATAFPKEYLSLHRSINPSANFAQYTVGGAVSGTNVRTAYTKLRIDPVARTVDTTDRRFATSTGATQIGTTPITAMDYGSAASCDAHASGIGNIDLQGTPFAVAPDAFALHGYLPAGSATYSLNDQVVNLTGGGFCGNITSGRPALPLIYF